MPDHLPNLSRDYDRKSAPLLFETARALRYHQENPALCDLEKRLWQLCLRECRRYRPRPGGGHFVLGAELTRLLRLIPAPRLRHVISARYLSFTLSPATLAAARTRLMTAPAAAGGPAPLLWLLLYEGLRADPLPLAQMRTGLPAAFISELTALSPWALSAALGGLDPIFCPRLDELLLGNLLYESDPRRLQRLMARKLPALTAASEAAARRCA